ncbi:hypothetical protein D3C85_944210 [compost metagenome]
MGFTAGVYAVIDANPYAEDSHACNAAPFLTTPTAAPPQVLRRVSLCHLGETPSTFES